MKQFAMRKIFGVQMNSFLSESEFFSRRGLLRPTIEGADHILVEST
jgi:hypothetical protein